MAAVMRHHPPLWIRRQAFTANMESERVCTSWIWRKWQEVILETSNRKTVMLTRIQTLISLTSSRIKEKARVHYNLTKRISRIRRAVTIKDKEEKWCHRAFLEIQIASSTILWRTIPVKTCNTTTIGFQIFRISKERWCDQVSKFQSLRKTLIRRKARYFSTTWTTTYSIKPTIMEISTARTMKAINMSRLVKATRFKPWLVMICQCRFMHRDWAIFRTNRVLQGVDRHPSRSGWMTTGLVCKVVKLTNRKALAISTQQWPTCDPQTNMASRSNSCRLVLVVRQVVRIRSTTSQKGNNSHSLRTLRMLAKLMKTMMRSIRFTRLPVIRPLSSAVISTRSLLALIKPYKTTEMVRKSSDQMSNPASKKEALDSTIILACVFLAKETMQPWTVQIALSIDRETIWATNKTRPTWKKRGRMTSESLGLVASQAVIPVLRMRTMVLATLHWPTRRQTKEVSQQWPLGDDRR